MNLAVMAINHIASKTISGDYPLEYTQNTSKAYTSGFIAPAAMPNGEFEIKSFVTNAGQSQFTGVNGSTVVPAGHTFIVPNDNTWGGGANAGGYPYPYIGDPLPVQSPPFGFPILPQTGKIEFVPLPPKLEDLEEGVHEIPGGKIIIKKIKVSEETLTEAMEEMQGHEATPEEKKKLHEDLEAISASEERDV